MADRGVPGQTQFAAPTAYLIKKVSLLRLTYQIRLLAYAANEEGCRLTVVIPTGSNVSPDLQAFVARVEFAADSYRAVAKAGRPRP